MQYDEVVSGRRSIRGYTSDPVPQSLIKEVLGLAMRSPSSMNTQPWNFTVVTGEVLDRIRQGNTERNLAGVPHSREFRIGSAFTGQHRDRQVGVAKQLFAAMDIAREIMKATGSQDVGVYIQATHGCCENRGIMANSSLTQTTVLKGAFYHEIITKTEFMDNIKMQQQFACGN